ncbi:hypothetical protein HK100_008238 [Physocladia obscura]|uniref:Uncharacterized protein n=1 Tax=Physocladia obscura TaxID=109957 RepID=A0AAD5SPY3_9FUNG|nr:hypothetical protein HK100_008238 [Physocladia obscura]
MDELFDTSAEQPHAHVVLHLHTIHRTVNLFSALATAGLTFRKLALRSASPPLFISLLRGNAVAVLLGIGAGAAAVEYRMQEKSNEEWIDRSYRIVHNKAQNAIDTWSAAGALSGFFIFTLTARKRVIVRGLGGAGLGSVVGIASYAFYKKTNKLGYVESIRAQFNR